MYNNGAYNTFQYNSIAEAVTATAFTGGMASASTTFSFGGIKFHHQPRIVAIWDEQLILTRLTEGQAAIYSKGYLLKGALEWIDESWVDGEEYSGIATLYRENTSVLLYYPRLDKDPTRNFKVHLSNGFDFIPHGGNLQKGTQTYKGRIEFESPRGFLTSTATPIF